MIQYSEKYDAYYSDSTNEWVDSKCGDPTCIYCTTRPAHPRTTPEKKSMDTKPANKVSGVLIRTNDTYMFRVYSEGETFTDYHIDHSDLAITIDDPDSTFYHLENCNILDHSPSTLGIFDNPVDNKPSS